MTQANCPNGVSLQDCHTNFFALADLGGIKWRRMRPPDHYNSLKKDPVEDPVLASYSRCLNAGELLCAWTRVERPAQDNSSGGQPSPVSPPTTFTKELWLFWYSRDPDFGDLLSEELNEVEQGCWETGLNYESRTVLFKAFHNLIERNLLSKGFARFGKWFTQPNSPANTATSNRSSDSTSSSTPSSSGLQISFSFDFFVHGDSTVCASVDVRNHPPVHRLHKHLLTVAQNSQSGVDVILSPYGLAGTLTGQSFKENDPAVQKFVADWKKFYPLTTPSPSSSSSQSPSSTASPSQSSSSSSKDGSYSSGAVRKQLPVHSSPFYDANDDPNHNSSSGTGWCPTVVEVVVAGVKMKYPSSYCFYSNDHLNSQLHLKTGLSPNNTNGMNADTAATTPSVFAATRELSQYIPAPSGIGIGRQPLDSLLTPPSSPPNMADTQTQTKLKTPVMSQHQPAKPSLIFSLRSFTEHNIVTKDRSKGELSEENEPFWPYVDPVCKVSCSCIRCRTPKKNALAKAGGQSSGPGPASKKEKDRMKKSAAFHRRNTNTDAWNTTPCQLNESLDSVKSQPTLCSQQAPSSVSSIQPKTPQASHSYKSPAPGGLPSLQSIATTPGGLDSPRSSNPMNGDGPGSVSGVSMGLPSVSPHPSKEQGDFHNDAVPCSPAVHSVVTKEKSQLEQLLSPYPASNAAKDTSLNGNAFMWTSNNNNGNNSQDGDDVSLRKPVLAECLDDSETTASSHLLYDYSVFNTEAENWDIPNAKRRRQMPPPSVKCDVTSGGNMHPNVSLKDPYEFKDGFDEEQPVLIKSEPQQLDNASRTAPNVTTKSATDPWATSASVNGTTTFPSEQQRSLTNGLGSVFASSPLTPNSQFMMNAGDLQASLTDLDQMFDPSSGDESIEADRCPGDSSSRKRSNNQSTSIPTDLSTMFPTPPSQETAAASPSTLALEATFDDSVACSPAFIERLRDSDIVYQPPPVRKIIASKNYVPVIGVTIPFELKPECKYRISTRDPYPRRQHQQNSESQLHPVNPIRMAGYTYLEAPVSPAYGPGMFSNRPPFVPHMPMAPAMSPSFGNRMNLPVRSPGAYAMPQMSPSPLQGALTGALTAKSVYPGDQTIPYGAPIPRGPRPVNPQGMFDTPVPSEQMGFRNNSLTCAQTPEVNSILVNLALSDSILNLFKDHNFDSCTICVCNMDIKGSDAGTYLPESLMPGADEPQYKCTCGFSAVVNRRKSPFSGLLYEDEVEVTGFKYEPTERYIRMCQSVSGGADVTSVTGLFGSLSPGELPPNASLMLDLIRSQCSYILSQSSLLSRAMFLELTCGMVSPDRTIVSYNEKMSTLKSDSSEIALTALRQGPGLLESFPKLMLSQDVRRSALKDRCLHDWQFDAADAPANNHDVVQFLRSLLPILQESVQKKPKAAAMWETTYPVLGPLTWRQFHKLATRPEDQCEPQPIPSLLIGHNREWVGTAPYALKMWEHLFYEPFSAPRDVAYLILTPDHPFILPKVKTFFKELTVAYESLRLGRHVPMCKSILPDGIFKVNKSAAAKLSDEKVEDQWFNDVADSVVGQRLRLYAQVCSGYVVPLIKGTSPTALTDLFKDPKPVSANTLVPNSNKPFVPNSSSGSGNTSNMNHSDAGSSDSKSDESGSDGNTSSGSGFQVLDEVEDDVNRQPVIVVYIVDPFCASQLDAESYKTACVGLLRCFAQVYKSLPDHQNCLNLQVISLENVIENALDVNRSTRQEQMKSLALSVFGQCRKTITPAPLAKSLTGFGPSASLEQILKEFTTKGLPIHTNRFFCPPFILAPLKDKQTELGEMFGERREKSMTLYCSYCITEDQRWIVASCSNERGDILETSVINIDVPNRNKRKGATVRKYGLNKLMEFFVTVMAEALEPWRLVIGRVGRLGHGEMKEWASLLSKKALQKATNRLKEKCDLCKKLNYFEIPSILSACLISLEPDTALRVFPDQVTTEDRCRSNACPLSTPEDASSTHLLVFPTSATISSSHGNFQNDPSNLGDDDLLGALGGCEDDLGVDDGMNDLFNWNEDLPSPGLQGSDQQGMSHPGSPGARQSGFDGSGLKESSGLNDLSDEPLQLLQQPLALGYYVSTAPTGPLPRWFWSGCSHLQGVSPVFLKAALLIHTPSVHQHTDDLMHHNKNGHPLDSNLTTDVLRYVLEGYNSLSWLVLDPATHDRASCLPIHIQLLMQLYSTVQALA